MKRNPAITPQQHRDILSRPEDFRTQERIPLTKAGVRWPYQLADTTEDERQFLILNSQQNSCCSSTSSVIEIALVRGRYNPKEGVITRIDAVYHSLNDPGEPLDWPFETMFGLSDILLKGQHIDQALVSGWLDNDPLILSMDDATKARPAFERLLPRHTNLEWSCLEDIKWNAPGFENCDNLADSLRLLGWFYEDDIYVPATADCLAMAWFLHQSPLTFAHLLDEVMQGTVLIKVNDEIESLSERGFSNFYSGKYQEYACREVKAGQQGRELAYLERKGVSRSQITCQHVSARSRFKPC